jgi:hypothetical protein
MIAPGKAAMTRFQPFPTLTMIGSLRGVTSITREWEKGECRLCGLCEVCTASENGVCNVLTTDEVGDAEAPLYSSLHLDFSGDGTTRDAAPLALAR